MDDKTLVAPTACFHLVEPRDVPSAVMTYRQIVQQSRKDDMEAKQADAEVLQQFKAMNNGSGDTTGQSVGLSKNDRLRMLLVLRDVKMISSIRKNEEMSDADLTNLYNQAIEQQRLRATQSEISRPRQQR